MVNPKFTTSKHRNSWMLDEKDEAKEAHRR